jgi:hypothetical protein
MTGALPGTLPGPEPDPPGDSWQISPVSTGPEVILSMTPAGGMTMSDRRRLR